MYILINTATAEVEFFTEVIHVKQFIEDNNLTDVIIMPCEEVEDRDTVELVIYPNQNHESIFGSVAEYMEDVYNSDFIKAPDVPVRYMHCYEYVE